MPDAGAGGLEEDEAAADAEGYGFGASGGTEFAEDGGYVEFGRVIGNVEADGDFLVGEADGQHLQDFALAASERLGEFGEGLRRARRGWVERAGISVGCKTTRPAAAACSAAAS